jgi:hypothetical protein
MTAKTRTNFKADQATAFADNTSGAITPAVLRGQVTDLADSAVFPEDLATTSTPGVMSASDKTKLDGVAPGANIVGTGITAIVALTQAAYDALTPKVATTLYVITD